MEPARRLTVAELRLPRITRDRRGYLTHELVIELSSQCGEHADLILTLAYTGVRWERWRRFDGGR